VAAGSVTASPTSLNFGSVPIGTKQSLTETVKNSGGESLKITQATFTGTGFSYTGLTLPLTLAPNQSSTFAVVFLPTSAATSSGKLSLTVSGSSTTVDVALSGTGVTPGTLTATPASVTFSSIQQGKTETQTETLKNTGGSDATISVGSVTGTGFSISGLSTPIILSPGQSTSFDVTFAPASSGSFSGNVAIASNASNPTLNIGLTGTATAPVQGQLSVSPGTISIGNVTVGTSGTQSGTLIATGSAVTVSGVSVGGTAFSITGISFPVTVTPGQNVSFTAEFTPQATGSASASLSFSSNASNSTAPATVTGTGVAAPAHSVNLSWDASSSPNVVGYNIYRRTGTTGTFARINTTLNATTDYTDSSVTDGQTYYYETTAVNSTKEESAPTTPVAAVIPAP